MANGSTGAAGQPMTNPPHVNGNNNGVLSGSNAPKVNNKKAKRRAKEAAKKREQELAQQAAAMIQVQTPCQLDNQDPDSDISTKEHHAHHAHHDVLGYKDAYADEGHYEDEQYYSDEDQAYRQEYDPAYPTGSHPPPPAVNGTGKKSKKKKKGGQGDPYASNHNHSHPHVTPPLPPPPSTMVRAHRPGRGDRIWNTSTSEERDRIKEFWLSLTEEERRSLVKVEKEAVLKKMKEQQKHSCSCTVCGRKRTAIEEELEVLYDAYYEELEQYADTGIPWAPLPGTPAPLSPQYDRQQNHRLPPNQLPALVHPHTPTPRAQIVELSDDDEPTEEDDYSDEYDDDEDYSDDEPAELPRSSADFFNFGNSLTVKGGILTVADDLLRNDGKKFIEMMEQLAERRMQREEEAQYAAATHPPYNDYRHGHNHSHSHSQSHSQPPPPDEDDFDEDEDEEYDSQEEYEEDEEDMDIMTEDQRIQEGRRMFQIFAARMFEQRVLTAYREKVAAERQQKLLEELEEEKGLDAAKEAKKAKDAEKKKAKKLAQKQKIAEEKAKKDAERSAQEAAMKAEQERKAEEQRKRKEEQRVKKEELRKAQEAELARKQAEKLKRVKEEQDRRQEAERKAREQKELERKTREEAKRREREEREAREKDAKEKKAKAEQERRESKTKEKAEQDKLRKEEQAVKQAHAAQQAAQAAKRAAAPPAVPILPGLVKLPTFASPHIQAAVPKAPSQARQRQGSQQGSKGSSPKTPSATAGNGKGGSPGVVGAPVGPASAPIAPKQILSRPPTVPPIGSVLHPGPMGMAHPPGMQLPQQSHFGMPPGLNGFTPGPLNMMPARGHMPPGMFSPQPQPVSGPFSRPFAPLNLNGVQGPPPGMGAPGLPPFRPSMEAPPGFNQMPQGAPLYGTAFSDAMPARTIPTPAQHSRHQSSSSATLDQPAPIGAGVAQPIRPPAPIARPSSVKPGGKEVDELANHLGSSALLEDDESPEPDFTGRRPSMPSESTAFGAPPPGFGNRAKAPRLESFGLAGAPGNTWGTSAAISFGTPSLPSASNWCGSPTGGWPSNNVFGLGLGGNPSVAGRPRHQAIRLAMIASYRAHHVANKTNAEGFVDAKSIYAQVRSTQADTASEEDVRSLLDTEGTLQNGGGSFQLRKTGEGELDVLVKWVPDDAQPSGRVGSIGGVGEMRSPIVGTTTPAPITPFGSLRGFPRLSGSGGLSGLGQGL